MFKLLSFCLFIASCGLISSCSMFKFDTETSAKQTAENPTDSLPGGPISYSISTLNLDLSSVSNLGGLTFDSGGALYVSDASAGSIYRYDTMSSSPVNEYGPGAVLRGMTSDDSENVYAVADSARDRIFKKTSSGWSAVMLDRTFGYARHILWLSGANVLVSDLGTCSVYSIDTNSGTSTVYIGQGSCDGTEVDGNLAVAKLKSAWGIALNRSTNELYIVDGSANKIKKLSNGNLSTIAGSGVVGSSDGNDALTSTFNGPRGVALDLSGNIIVVDSGNNVIRKIDIALNQTTTVAGQVGVEGMADGDGLGATFGNWQEFIYTNDHINFYITDWRNKKVRKMSLH